MTWSKQELRRAIRASRAQEPAAVAAARGQALAGAAGELTPWAAGGVAAYLPTNAEPDVGPLLRALGAPAYLPRVTASGLEWVAATADEVVGMRTGIPRPAGPAVATGAALVTELGVGLLLVPALAVDPAGGTRLGYGAGWYDRFLAEVRRAPVGVAAVGVCRGVDLVAVPGEPHDEPLDGVLTEDGLVWFAARQ